MIPRPVYPVNMVVIAALVGLVSLVPRIATAEENHPVCGEEDSKGKICWAPLTSHPGCHFLSILSRDVTTDVTWSGTCEDDRATGEGSLADASGNRAEGRFVVGRRDGQWVWRFADGMMVEATYVDGLLNGPIDMTYPDGRSVRGRYEDNSPVENWETRWTDGYSEVGSFEKRRRHGTWTVTWPDGVEALVPYVEGRIHGEVTVRHNGEALGTLTYWEGERLGPGLPPTLLPMADE